MVSHASSGIVNRFASDQLGALRTMDPTVYTTWSDDFLSFTSGDWIVTESDAGSTELIVDGAGGLLAITNVSAGATDYAQIQWSGSAAAARLNIYGVTSKDLLMKARFKVSDATNTGIFIGAGTVDTSLVASAPTDGIYFAKADQSTSLIGNVRKAGTSSTITMGTMAADTFVEATLAYVADQAMWTGYLNNSPVGTISGTTNFPTNGLSVGIGLLNGSAAAHVLTIDYLNIWVQR